MVCDALFPAHLLLALTVKLGHAEEVFANHGEGLQPSYFPFGDDHRWGLPSAREISNVKHNEILQSLRKVGIVSQGLAFSRGALKRSCRGSESKGEVLKYLRRRPLPCRMKSELLFCHAIRR